MDIDDARSVIYGSLGNLYNIQDQAHLAIHYYQLALPIFEKHDWRESQTILYYNIGELYAQMGNYGEAERNYLKAIEKAKESGDSLMMTLPKKGLSGVYFNTGQHDKALQTADEALAYYRPHRKEEPQDFAYTLASKARILMMAGHEDVAAAKACVEEALPYIDSTEMMFDDAAEIYMAASEVAMAEQTLAAGPRLRPEERPPRLHGHHCRQGRLYVAGGNIYRTGTEGEGPRVYAEDRRPDEPLRHRPLPERTVADGGALRDGEEGGADSRTRQGAAAASAGSWWPLRPCSLSSWPCSSISNWPTVGRKPSWPSVWHWRRKRRNGAYWPATCTTP